MARFTNSTTLAGTVRGEPICRFGGGGGCVRHGLLFRAGATKKARRWRAFRLGTLVPGVLRVARGEEQCKKNRRGGWYGGNGAGRALTLFRALALEKIPVYHI